MLANRLNTPRAVVSLVGWPVARCAGAALTAPVVGAICVGLGVPTGGLGTLACGVVVVAAGSYAGGAVGGAGGEMFGEVIYEVTK